MTAVEIFILLIFVDIHISKSAAIGLRLLIPLSCARVYVSVPANSSDWCMNIFDKQVQHSINNFRPLLFLINGNTQKFRRRASFTFWSLCLSTKEIQYGLLAKAKQEDLDYALWFRHTTVSNRNG